MDVNTAAQELLKEVGKLAMRMGVEWRLEHAELMDAHDALCLALREREVANGA